MRRLGRRSAQCPATTASAAVRAARASTVVVPGEDTVGITGGTAAVGRPTDQKGGRHGDEQDTAHEGERQDDAGAAPVREGVAGGTGCRFAAGCGG
jgi:hypothetical protein